MTAKQQLSVLPATLEADEHTVAAFSKRVSSTLDVCRDEVERRKNIITRFQPKLET